MILETFASYEELSERAAQIIADRIKSKPNLILGLATGSTPVGLYRRLVAEYRAGRFDFSQVSTFNLDEYCGLAPDHQQSYHSFMDDNFFNYVNIDPRRQHWPACDRQSCRQYEASIRQAGGIDLQILGIGRNGHIGFNEPGSFFDSRTRIVDLSATTLLDNARFFNREEDLPRQAVTMGLAAIMAAKEIILLASGEAKKEAVQNMFKVPASVAVPASVLQHHLKVVVLADEAAAGDLEN